MGFHDHVDLGGVLSPLAKRSRQSPPSGDVNHSIVPARIFTIARRLRQLKEMLRSPYMVPPVVAAVS